MEKTRLGRTELRVSRTGFGGLPIQRVDFDTAKCILRRAYEGGVNFFDTARSYSDSEEKLGYALVDFREDVVLATKTLATDRAGVLEQLETSLGFLKTDYIDIMQLHNPTDLPDPEDPESSYSALVEARDKGMIRFLGITCHRRSNALEAIASGLYDTIQFPLSAISSDADLEILARCSEADLGLIAMKALCGGLLTNVAAAFAFLRQFENVVPIFGIQRMEELEEFLVLEADPPLLDDALLECIEEDRKELAGDYCRGCGYCLPCPAEIPIPMAARIGSLLRRARASDFLTEEWQAKMQRVHECTHCGECQERCPYELDAPSLLEKNVAQYEAFLTKV